MTALSPDLPAPPGKSRPPERRDPAWRGRLAGAVVALLLGINFLADGMRDLLDADPDTPEEATA